MRDPLDVALVAAAAMGGCIGFLWWNAAPARIFMGDTGSLALGGLIAGLSMVTRTELLLVVIGGLFVVETLSVSLQIVVFRTARRRLFRMAPFHHHFELAGWAETTVIIRFWLLAAMCAALGLGMFYSDWLGACGGDVDRAIGRLSAARPVLVAGAGVSGLAAARVLLAEGARCRSPTTTRPRSPTCPTGAGRSGGGPGRVPDGTELVVTSPGRRPGPPARRPRPPPRRRGDRRAELAWRLGAAARRAARLARRHRHQRQDDDHRDARRDPARRPVRTRWPAATSGYPVVSRGRRRARVLAVELSSFQLHWSPSVRPGRGRAC